MPTVRIKTLTGKEFQGFDYRNEEPMPEFEERYLAWELGQGGSSQFQHGHWNIILAGPGHQPPQRLRSLPRCPPCTDGDTLTLIWCTRRVGGTKCFGSEGHHLPDFWPPLLVAVATNDIAAARQLLGEGADPCEEISCEKPRCKCGQFRHSALQTARCCKSLCDTQFWDAFDEGARNAEMLQLIEAAAGEATVHLSGEAGDPGEVLVVACDLGGAELVRLPCHLDDTGELGPGALRRRLAATLSIPEFRFRAILPDGGLLRDGAPEGGGSFCVAWHVRDHAEGEVFASQWEAQRRYNMLDNGGHATVMCDPEGKELARYGCMKDHEWQQLLDWCCEHRSDVSAGSDARQALVQLAAA